MGKVRILDRHTAELIAAGEVVERPASVIKELVENSIDAGARSVTVEIKSGGVRYMRITDDGEGIAHEDVPTAFLRHATSKIAGGEDLAAIATLGFRGEALASISSVARVELITRTAEQETGTHYVIEGGEQAAYDECGCACGTTIIVRDIFYNTPARMKFLKKDVQEGNAVASCIDRLALSHPEISFRLVRDGKQTLMTSGDGRLKSAIYAVFGKDFTEGLMPVDYTLKNVRVSGFASLPTHTRPNSSMQVFFINGRYCRSKTMQAALEQSYKGAIMVGRHPSCVLNVQIDCSSVDVNVHPAKLEVRFTNERPVFEGVYYAVLNAVSGSDARREIHIPAQKQTVFAPPEPPAPVQAQLGNLVKATRVIEKEPEATPLRAYADIVIENNTECAIDVMSPKVRDSGVYTAAAGKPDVLQTFLRQTLQPSKPPAETNRSYNSSGSVNINITAEETLESDAALRVTESIAEHTRAAEKTAVTSVCGLESELPVYRIIGEAFATYIILESGDQLILIDKHAAHERLIYERLMAREKGGDAQLLLEPVSVTLDKLQYDALLRNTEMMREAGFELEDFGPGTILVRTAPTVMIDTDIADAVTEIAGNLGVKKNALVTEKMEQAMHTIACRSAIKANDRSLEPELASLVMQLMSNPGVRYCPHGRPIYTVLKKREIEKNFGRIQ